MLRHLIRDPHASDHAHFSVRDYRGRADYLLRSWPQPRCFRRAFGETSWMEFEPPLLAWKACIAQGNGQLLDDRARSARWGRRATEGQGELAFDSPPSRLNGGLTGFWKSVPEPVRSPISQLTAGEWTLVRFAAVDGSTADLVQSNLALALALTTPERFLGRRVFQKPRLQREWARRRQHEALVELGFPSSRGVRRILQRIRPEALSVEALVELRQAMRHGALKLPLGHLRQQNAGTLALVCDDTARAHLSNRVLIEVSESNEERFEARSAFLLRDCVWMLHELGRSSRGFQPDSTERIRTTHDELVRELALRRLEARERPADPEILPRFFDDYPEAQGFRLQPTLDLPQLEAPPPVRAEPVRPAPPRRPPRARSVPRDAVFPNPPLPDGGEAFGVRVRALRTKKELRAWATAQKNCAAGYGRQVLAGTYYLYAVSKPEPATLGLYYSASAGRWAIEQLKGPKNRRVTKGTAAGVRAWLANANS